MKDFGSQCPKGSSYTDRVVFEEQVAPLVLDIEEEREHDDDVDYRDEGHDDKTTVHDQNSQLIYSENFSIWKKNFQIIKWNK